MPCSKALCYDEREERAIFGLMLPTLMPIESLGISLHNMLFWELFGVNLCSLFGVKLGHAGAGGVVGRDSGYCVITLSGCLNHTLSSIDRRGRRGSSLSDGATFLGCYAK
jgi:hypothetical protein